MATNRLVKSKQTLSRAELADLLTAVAEQIRGGQVVMRQGDSAVEAPLPEDLRVDVELSDAPKRTGVKRELEIEIHWQVDEDGAPVVKTAPGRLTIG